MERIYEVIRKFDEEFIKTVSQQKLLILDLEKIDYVNHRTIRKIQIEYEIYQEKLYIGKWDEISNNTKNSFLNLSFILSACFLMKESKSEIEDMLKILKIIDTAIIYDVENVSSATRYLKELAVALHEFLVQTFPFNTFKSLAFANSSQSPSQDDICDVAILDHPATDFFYSFYYPHKPVKIINSINHWEALDKWKNVEYLVNLLGYRTVPIELGDKYDSDDWCQGLFRFAEFIEESILKSENSSKAYLAQHNLFDQIEALKNDFSIPKYCVEDLSLEDSPPVNIKAWIGPANTVSSMHTDDKHNIFCQVVGEKLVILAAPEDKDNLYTYEGILNNTSKVDPENLDFEEFPNTRNVKFFKVIVRPGEMLYIPKLWFHHVRSLSNSISISFWFE